MYDKYLERLKGVRVCRPGILNQRLGIVNMPKMFNMSIYIAAALDVVVQLVVLFLGFFGFIYSNHLVMGLSLGLALGFFLYRKWSEMRRALAKDKLIPGFNQSEYLDKALTKHNDGVEIVKQTISLRKSLSGGDEDQEFFDLIERVVSTIEENHRRLDMYAKRYRAVSEAPIDLHEQFQTVITEDLAMPAELDTRLIAEQVFVTGDIEMKLALPELLEVLNCREFLALRS